MSTATSILKISAVIGIISMAAGFALPAQAGQTLVASKIDQAATIDGNPAEWSRVPAIVVPLKGKGKVDSVELKAAVRDGMIYVYAKWADSTESRLHKPYKWNEASQSYKRTRQLEDRFAISLEMSGNFSANKIDGSIFNADVWHWKAGRTDPAGIAHDKMHKVSDTPFKKGKKFKAASGKTVYLGRLSDAGDRLYRAVKFDAKQQDVMKRYEVNTTPSGSIADVRAKGMWRDGYWHLEFARKFDTGNSDDAVIPADGTIKIAVAAFNNVGGRNHSTSEIIVLNTSGMVLLNTSAH